MTAERDALRQRIDGAPVFRCASIEPTFGADVPVLWPANRWRGGTRVRLVVDQEEQDGISDQKRPE